MFANDSAHNQYPRSPRPNNNAPSIGRYIEQGFKALEPGRRQRIPSNSSSIAPRNAMLACLRSCLPFNERKWYDDWQGPHPSRHGFMLGRKPLEMVGYVRVVRGSDRRDFWVCRSIDGIYEDSNGSPHRGPTALLIECEPKGVTRRDKTVPPRFVPLTAEAPELTIGSPDGRALYASFELDGDGDITINSYPGSGARVEAICAQPASRLWQLGRALGWSAPDSLSQAA